MDITGRLVQILPEQTGDGKNGKWVKCDFVIETQEKFPKKVCLTAWGDLIGMVKNVPMESEMKVSFDISSREYNGRWYTDVKAWKVEATGVGGTPPSRTAGSSDNPSGAASSNEGSSERYISEDDLPF